MLATAGFLFFAHHYWVDRLNPWVLRFGNGFGIRWYGVAYLAGFLLAGWILARWVRQGRLPIQGEDVSLFLLYAGMGVLIGGRLGYCLFYNLHEVIHDPLEIVRVWHGGMASHGGILGLIVAIWIFAKKRSVNFLPMLDAAAATGPLGIALGRLANFVNGELWGRPSTVPWAVIFPQAPLVNGVVVPRHPSQLYAAAIEGILIFLIAQWVFARSRRPGLTTATVCVAYGVGRFIDEFWRQPDVGQPVYWGWMSKGQLLTIPMILIGILWLVYCRRSTVKHRVPAPPATVPAQADAAANSASKQRVDR
jgi:phosphatidylglycerol---prolipoprotein diacylglyceryl transferase